VFALPSGLNVIPVEKPAPTRPVSGPSTVVSWIVPVKPFKLVKVSIVSAQYPNGMMTFAGLADTLKSGVVARTGLGKLTVPKTMSVNSAKTMVR
jgi:hypothetical protein